MTKILVRTGADLRLDVSTIALAYNYILCYLNQKIVKLPNENMLVGLLLILAIKCNDDINDDTEMYDAIVKLLDINKKELFRCELTFLDKVLDYRVHRTLEDLKSTIDMMTYEVYAY